MGVDSSGLLTPSYVETLAKSLTISASDGGIQPNVIVFSRKQKQKYDDMFKPKVKEVREPKPWERFNR